jgi:hypothetical protein
MALRAPRSKVDIMGFAMRAIGITSGVVDAIGVPAAKLVCGSLQQLLNVVMVSHLLTFLFVCLANVRYQEVDQNQTQLVWLFDQTTEISQLLEDELSERIPEWALSPSFFRLCEDFHQYVRRL